MAVGGGLGGGSVENSDDESIPLLLMDSNRNDLVSVVILCRDISNDFSQLC